MELLLEPFKKFIAQHHLFHSKDHLLIAVSGGVDSVVLCELCRQAGFNFSIAHCNFKLRAAESDADEAFVRSLGEKYGVPVFVKQFETESYASENKISIQVAAREMRYNWFQELLNQSTTQLRYLLTAHHADDNIETIAMNFFKGSGINGLKGILPKQQHIIRPLLFATKEQILEFASQHNLPYREDSSNSSNKYTRNYFRNELLPAVEKVFPQVKENLLHNAERFREINIIYQTAVKKTISKLVVTKGTEQHIPVLKLQLTEAMPTVLYEIIKDYNFKPQQTEEVIKLLSSESGKYVASATHRILRNRKWLIIAALNNTASQHHLLESPGEKIIFEAGKLAVETAAHPVSITNDPLHIHLDAANIQFPLLLRKWKTGDYFYPLGLGKKKKISRFLIDIKMPLHQKQDVWVLESNKKIIWVLGLRIDDRFKITDSTQGTLLLCLDPDFPAN